MEISTEESKPYRYDHQKQVLLSTDGHKKLKQLNVGTKDPHRKTKWNKTTVSAMWCITKKIATDFTRTSVIFVIRN